MSLDQLYTNVLPPCLVCGSKASGLHYGVNTCEACKAFFRRSSNRGHQFECAKQRSCKIEGKSRSTCAHCRFQKCLRLGMCKEESTFSMHVYSTDMAPETAQYSCKQKTYDLSSCEILQADTVGTDDSITYETDLISSATVDISLNNEKPSDVCEPVDVVTTSESISNINSTVEHDVTADSEVVESSGLDGHSVGSPDSKRKLYDPSRIVFYEEIIQKLCAVHTKLEADHMAANVVLAEKENECLEMVKLREQIFGPMRPIPVEEYIKFYTETGIDIDGRRELLESVLLPQLEQAIRQHISFAKFIPGFGDLSHTEQIEIIKESRLDFFVFGRHQWFNPKDKLFAFHGGKVVHVSEVLKLLDRDSVEIALRLQRRIRELNLRIEETVILYALSIMWPDFTDMQYRRVVEESQETLVECLFYIFDKYDEADNSRFASMINCVTQMRTLREDDFKCKPQIIDIWWNIVNFPPLLYEICEL